MRTGQEIAYFALQKFIHYNYFTISEAEQAVEELKKNPNKEREEAADVGQSNSH